MFKIISPAFLAAFTLLFAMKPLVPSCVSQTMHLVHQTQRLFYFFKLFIDVSTVIRKIFVDMLVKFMFWFLLELGNLFLVCFDAVFLLSGKVKPPKLRGLTPKPTHQSQLLLNQGSGKARNIYFPF